MRKIASTKSGALKRDVIRYAGGSKSEVWYVGAMMLSQNPGDGRVIVVDQRSMERDFVGPLGNPESSSGFPGLSWLAQTNYVGVDMVDKRPCHHFQVAAKESAPPSLGSGPEAVTVTPSTMIGEAWIDIETRVPVACRHDGVRYSYRFESPPVSPLALPPDFEVAWKDYQKMSDRLQRLQGVKN